MKKSEKILIVDDKQSNRRILRKILKESNYQIFLANNGVDAIKIAKTKAPDLVLLDIRLTVEMDGYEVCRIIKEHPTTQHIPVIFITSSDDEATGIVHGFKEGAVDFITRPCRNEVVMARVKNHLKISSLTQQLTQKSETLQIQAEELRIANENYQVASEKRERAENERNQARATIKVLTRNEAKLWKIDDFISHSAAIGQIMAEVRNLQGINTSVLISGESGTGKELIARAIHYGGRRRNAPFIPVNCSAIPKDLAESLFFGHVRGAFTGSNTNQQGYFELANGGSLFLDEIGDMPLALQAKLLRVLEEGYITPIGDSQEKSIDVRVLSATNANLKKNDYRRLISRRFILSDSLLSR